MQRNGALAREGLGANVLGDPWLALVWLANELATYDAGLHAGRVVTTGPAGEGGPDTLSQELMYATPSPAPTWRSPCGVQP